MQVQILEEMKENEAVSKRKMLCHCNKRLIVCLFLTVIKLVILIISGCKFGIEEAFYRPDGVNFRSKNLLSLQLDERISNSSVYQTRKYNFMVFTDIHYGAGAGYNVPEQQILNWIDSFDVGSSTQAAQKPVFCIVLGDITETGNADDYTAFNRFQNAIEAKGIPVYCVVGNHDILNSGWSSWKNNCNPGTSFYCFSTHTVSWYFTDNGDGTYGSKQFSALETAFKNDNRRKLVFSHIPLYGGIPGKPELIMCSYLSDTKERAKIINLFAKNNVKCIFNGHWHEQGYHDFGKFKEYVQTTLKDGKWYLVSVDETTENDADPITSVTTINLTDLQN